MAPFALSIATGVYKGVIEFKIILKKSKAFELEEDLEKLNKFTALMVFIAGSVTAVPIVTITIFFYQAYADQYFVMFVLGIEMFVVTKMMKGYWKDRTVQIISLFSCLLMFVGCMVWVAMDPDQMLRYAIFAKNNMFLNVVTMLKSIINMGFNYFFSKLAAMNGIHVLTSNMFKNFDKVIYQKKDGAFVKSKLWLIDIWGYLKNKKKADVLDMKLKNAGLLQST
eukprot:g6271.t1